MPVMDPTSLGSLVKELKLVSWETTGSVRSQEWAGCGTRWREEDWHQARPSGTLEGHMLPNPNLSCKHSKPTPVAHPRYLCLCTCVCPVGLPSPLQPTCQQGHLWGTQVGAPGRAGVQERLPSFSSCMNLGGHATHQLWDIHG